MKKIFGKKLVKIIAWIAIVFFVLLTLLISLAYVYEDYIKQFSINQINKNINAKIKVEKIDFSFIKHFPLATLNFDNLLLIGATKDSLNTDNVILQAKEMHFSFNLLQIFKNNFELESIVISDAKINIIIDEKGMHNLNILKPSTDSTSNFFFNLNLVNIHNSELNYINKATKQNLNLLIKDIKFNGLFRNDNFNILLDGKSQINSFSNKGREIVSNKQLDLNVQLLFEPQKGKYSLKKGQLIFQGVPLNLTGSITFKSQSIGIDATLNSQNLNIENIIKYLPKESKDKFEKYNPKGFITINGIVKGEIGGSEVPFLSFNTTLKNFSFNEPKTNLSFKNASMKLYYNNGSNKSLETSIIKITDLITESNLGKFKADILISNLWTPAISANITSAINLEQLKSVFKIDTISKLEGTANLESNISFDLKQKNTEWSVFDIKMNHKYIINNVEISFKHNDNIYKITKAEGVLENNNLTVTNFSLLNKNSILNGNLIINNIPIYYNDGTNRNISISGNINANALTYNQIAEALPASNDNNDSRFPKTLNINLNLNINSFSYKQIQLQNVSGNFIMENRDLYFKGMNFDCFEGKINGNLKIDGETNNIYKLNSSINLSKLNITTLFKAFNNFNQDIIKSNNIKGQLSGSYDFMCNFDKNWNINSNSIKLNSEMKIFEGELIDIQALNALKTYTKIKDFSNIKFSTLTNSISIADSKIVIPEMEVMSDVMNIKLSGTHNFDNEYEYQFTILLSEILGRHYKDELNTEFGEIQDNGYGRTQLFLTLKGKAALLK